MMKRTFVCVVLGLSLSASAQETRDVKGTVLDQYGNPMPGVTVEVKKTQERTSADVDGTFELAVPAGKKKLKATYQGYIDAVHKIGKKSPDMLIWMDPIKDYNRRMATRFWPRKGYFNIAVGFHGDLKENGIFKAHPNVEESVQIGYTFRLHKRPVAHTLMFGLDWTFLDFSLFIYDSFEPASTTSPYLNPYSYSGTQNYDTEFQIGIASMLGPSVAIAPFTRMAGKKGLRYLCFNLFYRVGPNFDIFDELDDDLNINVAQTVGVGFSWKRIGAGFEHRWTRGGDFTNVSNRAFLSLRLGTDGTKKSMGQTIRDENRRSRMEKTAASIEGTTKIIKGQVLDKQGLPLAGARVEATGGAEQVLTDKDGNFTLEVPKWLLSATASAEGYKNKTVKVKPENKPLVFKLGKK